MSAREKWDTKYAAPGYLFGNQPRAILTSAPLPQRGSPESRLRALDVACGEGQNAVWLAEQGFEVTGIDISPVGLAKARALAQSRGVAVDFRQADLDQLELGDPYDVIVCTHYLNRAILPKLEAALAPGGVFVGEWSLTLRSFPVAPDEPPRWFPHLQILVHRPTDELVQLIARKQE